MTKRTNDSTYDVDPTVDTMTVESARKVWAAWTMGRSTERLARVALAVLQDAGEMPTEGDD